MAATKTFMLGLAAQALVVLASDTAAVRAQQCSETNPCANKKCCSKWGWCGCTDAYCGAECRGQCRTNCGAAQNVRTPPHRPVPLPGTEPFIGVAYGRVANNLPSHAQVVALLRTHGVRKVKLYNANREVLHAFNDSGIKLSVAVPNQEVVAIANSQAVADAWITSHVVEFNSFITSIGMGNEWLLDSRNDRSKLLPAMENLYYSLQKHGYSDRIKVSTPHAFDIPGFPPSAARFRNEPLMRSLLGFLRRSNAPFMLNCYPFFPYAVTPQIDPDYALFKRSSALVWDQGRGYMNLFDAMVDTAISAMRRVGCPDVPIVVTETGWPNGGSDRRGVGVENARIYNQNLVKHVLGKNGTPLRPGWSISTYIFALFNENGKRGGYQNEEKHWGHFFYNMKPIYELNMSG